MSFNKEKVKEVQTELANSGKYDNLDELKKYNNKDKIKLLQRELINSGYLSNKKRSDGSYIEEDGILGNNTRNAFIKRNREKNIDGIVGERTKKGYLSMYDSNPNGNPDRNPRINHETHVCAKGVDGCAQWVTKKYEGVAGLRAKRDGVISNAWQMPKLIEENGGNSLYSIYDDSFNGVKDVNQLKQLTEQALINNPIDYSILKAGDIVGIYMPSSNMHEVALKEGTTKNTHVGYVVGVDKDGMPIVEHNINGSLRRDRADKLSGSSNNRRARIATASRPRISGISEITPIEYDEKQSRYQIEGKDNEHLKTFMNSIEGSSEQIGKIFPDANMDAVGKIAIAVQGRETDFMTNRTSDQLERDGVLSITGLKNLARNTVRTITGKTEDSKSSNMSKFKFNSLSKAEQEYLGIHSPKDLEDASKAGLASNFILARNYDYFKRLQKTYSELNLTDDDVENLTILSYNQGMSKLSHIGFDEKTGKIKLKEIETLRNLAREDAKIKDVKSTNYRYLGKVGEALYNKFGKSYTPYISAARTNMNKIKDSNV